MNANILPLGVSNVIVCNFDTSNYSERRNSRRGWHLATGSQGNDIDRSVRSEPYPRTNLRFAQVNLRTNLRFALAKPSANLAFCLKLHGSGTQKFFPWCF